MNSNKFDDELITLIDDEGNEHEFEVLDILEIKEGMFYALTPAFDGLDFIEENTYYIFETVEKDGETHLAEVEDEDLLERLAVVFESRFEKFYDEF
jgi:uncharacterized protein YrzB (UPF0473 family)